MKLIRECICNMSIQQSVNNMLATAAVVGGVAKHGVEEEARNKLQAIDEYFGAKEKLYNLQSENEANILAKKENKAELKGVRKEADETYENIETARSLQRISEDKMTEFASKDYSTMSPEEVDMNMEEYGTAQENARFYRDEQAKGYEKINELNKQMSEIHAANKSLKSQMKANETQRIAAQAHIDAIKSGKYKKFIEQIEGGKK